MLRAHAHLILIILGWLVCSGPATALTVAIENSFRSQWIGPGVEYIEDSTTHMTSDEVRQRTDWQAFDGLEINFSFSDSVFWLRFTIDNQTDSNQYLLLDNQFPLIDHIDIHIQRSDGIVLSHSLGDALPAHTRSLHHPHLLLPLDLPAHTRAELLIRVQSVTGLQLPIKLWERNTFLEQDHVLSMMRGTLYGLLIALGIYHVIIFISVREPAFLYYALLNLFLLGVYTSLHGIAAAYIWPASITANDTLVLVSIAGMQLFAALFINAILEIPATRPHLAKLLLVVAGIALLALLASLVLPHQLMAKPVLLLSGVFMLVLTYAQIRRMLDGYPIAKIIVIGGVIAVSGFAVTTLANTGFITATPLTQGAAYVGIVLMSLVDAFAVSHRMNLDRQLRLEAQHQLLNTQRQLNADLDRRVQERTSELEAANIRLLELSTTDGLTGLNNRRHFNDVFDQELKRACREKSTLSLLLLDIDHFKQLNDQYGHPFGDLCLTQAAQLINNAIRRPPDIAARYGGEEFAVLLPNTDKNGALHVANKIRELFNQHSVNDGQQHAVMTVSIGVTSLIPGQQNTSADLLKTADTLLYRAKQNGRNRVEG